MANYEKTQYGEEGFFFGDNIAESGTVTSADANVPKGTILVRDSAKNWVSATSVTLAAGTGLGVAVADIDKGTSVPADIGIGGKFNRNWLKVGDDPITDAQADVLRGQGIIAYVINSVDKQ